MIAVASIEDDPTFARRLRAIFDASPDIAYVACCASIDDAVAKIPSCNPDVILVDIYLENGQFGYDAVALLKDHLPDAEFVMLTHTGDYDRIFTSIANR